MNAKTDRTARLLFGYLPNQDYPQTQAFACGLKQRFCLILPAQVRSHVSLYFDYELLIALLDAMLKHIPHDVAHYIMDRETGQILNSLQDLRQYYVGRPPSHRDPFRWAWLLAGRKERCLIETIDHTQDDEPTGPYDGSYVFACYVSQLDPESLEQHCRSACAALGAELQESIHASPEPRISLWTRLYDFIVSDAPEEYD